MQAAESEAAGDIGLGDEQHQRLIAVQAVEARLSPMPQLISTLMRSPPIRPPFACYSHGVEIPPGARLLLCSGQLGVGLDDAVPDDAAAQVELCFANIGAILASAGMELSDVVRLSAFVTGREHLPAYMAVRDRLFPDAASAPASTLMIVTGFSRPEFKVEVEAIAARI